MNKPFFETMDGQILKRNLMECGLPESDVEDFYYSKYFINYQHGRPITAVKEFRIAKQKGKIKKPAGAPSFVTAKDL